MFHLPCSDIKFSPKQKDNDLCKFEKLEENLEHKTIIITNKNIDNQRYDGKIYHFNPFQNSPYT
jgi:hypothetical protein